MKIIAIAALSTSLALAGAARADGLAIKPGLWKTTTNTTMPMGGGVQTRSTEDCVTETSFDPASMMEDAEGCTLTRNEVSGNQLDFVMECDMQGTQATMTGQFVSDGDTGSGSMNMQMNAGGMNMEMKMDWTSERIGDC